MVVNIESMLLGLARLTIICSAIVLIHMELIRPPHKADLRTCVTAAIAVVALIVGGHSLLSLLSLVNQPCPVVADWSNLAQVLN